MASKVYFANLRARSMEENKANKLKRLFAVAGFSSFLKKDLLTAVKLHFGERGNDTHLNPVLVRTVVDAIKEAGAKPFITDTNTLYAGKRHNAVDHVETATLHGFTQSVVNAPVLIADGLLGESVTNVPIEGKHFSQTKIAGAIVRAEALMVLSHFKGHELAGFGGAIKNLAMGCASGAGKREQHSVRFYVNTENCIGCGECQAVCPTEAASVFDGVAVIDKTLCVGCGECYIHCPEKAIELDWRTEVPLFMERMTEYAYAAVQGKQQCMGYINFLQNITPDCDCVPWSDAPIVPDIGILASTDPVAIDQASLDLVNKQAGIKGTHLKNHQNCGEHKFEGLWGHTSPDIQLSYGQELGLGSREYELVEI